jgi:hypothetical protein
MRWAFERKLHASPEQDFRAINKEDARMDRMNLFR